MKEYKEDNHFVPKIWPLLLAFLLLCSVLTLGYQKVAAETEVFNTTTHEALCYGPMANKLKDPELVRDQLTPKTVLFLGSSELSTIGESTHPVNFYNDGSSNFDLMLLGKGYMQSLSHSIILGALGKENKSNVVVLTLSPQWFTADHINPDAFASVFPVKYMDLLFKNLEVPKEIKQKILNRSKEILGKSSKHSYSKEIKKWEKMLVETPQSVDAKVISDPPDYSLAGITNKITSFTEKAFNRVHQLQNKNNNERDGENESFSRPTSFQGKPAFNIPFPDRMSQAEKEGRMLVTNNDFDVNDRYFNEYMKGVYEKRKDIYKGHSYTVSQEYSDLELFLEVAKALDQKVLLLSIPVQGKWYDFGGFKKEDRQAYYSKVRNFAMDHDVALADFSEHEYTKYFFRDTMHVGWKGWVYIEDKVEQFYRQNHK